MKVLGVIPARYKSSRFEGKVIADLAGQPMIQHVWERAKKSQRLDDVLIACDDDRVARKAKAFGAKVAMTSPDHPSGSDRIAQVVSSLNVEIVVNIQGDEPLLESTVIDQLVDALQDSKDCPVATVIRMIEDKRELDNPNIVKVVVDSQGVALYFSRAVIPFDRDGNQEERIEHYKHLGLYAYRKDFLLKFTQMPPSRLEMAEKLEQLRILEAGYKIKTIVTKFDTIGVDTPEDLKRVEKLLLSKVKR